MRFVYNVRKKMLFNRRQAVASQLSDFSVTENIASTSLNPAETHTGHDRTQQSAWLCIAPGP